MNDVIQKFMQKGIIVSSDLVNYFDKIENIDSLIENMVSDGVGGVLSKEIIEKYIVPKNKESQINIIESYNEISNKWEVNDFSEHLKARYNELKDILTNRIELSSSISINKLNYYKEGEEVAIIGLVLEKSETKKGNILLTLEDPTDITKAVITKNNEEMYEIAKNLTLDEAVGLTGTLGKGIIFGREIIQPDLPHTHEFKKGPDEVYAAFIADLHFGSNEFLKDEFQKFIKWINGESGNEEQREIALKIKYLFVVGDIVDGVGIYPNQDLDLFVDDVKVQYDKCAEFFKQFRKDLNIIACPGNHDALRLSEPQPPFDRKYAEALFDIPNLELVSNPAVINIESTENFEGFNILLYHGYGFHYYLKELEGLRKELPYDNPRYVMEYMLKRRHLGPTHSASLYIPLKNMDPRVMRIVPDVFVAACLHKMDIGRYKNTQTINCSCWQDITDFQIKVGSHPDYAKVPVLNLKTRDIKIFNFKTE